MAARSSEKTQFELEAVRILLARKKFVKKDSDLSIQGVAQSLNLRGVVVRVRSVDS